jgi:hypothetical protein
VNCRGAGDTTHTVGHCAIRVTDKDRGLDVIIEMMPADNVDEVYWRSAPGDIGGSWL